jgi:hypothetical protein
VCDPVMGDQGKLYVAPELVPLFRDTLVPLADLVTPNQFELEYAHPHPSFSIHTAAWRERWGGEREDQHACMHLHWPDGVGPRLGRRSARPQAHR